MNYTVVFDWKFVVALGVATASIILAEKLDVAEAKEVSIHAIDAYKRYTDAIESNC